MFSCTMIISLICIAIRHKAELALNHVVWQNNVFCECEEIYLDELKWILL